MAKRIMPSFPKIEQETGDAREMAEPLVTLPMRGTDAFHLDGPTPIGRCRDRAGMRAKANHGGPIAEGLATELPDVQLLPDNAHLCIAGIADMGVVRPDDCLGLGPSRIEQMSERLEHMSVAQVPRLRTAVIHDPVIPLRRRFLCSATSKLGSAGRAARRALERVGGARSGRPQPRPASPPRLR